MDPSSSAAEKDWLHWIRTFENFISVLPTEGLNKLQVLTNYIAHEFLSMLSAVRGMRMP